MDRLGRISWNERAQKDPRVLACLLLNIESRASELKLSGLMYLSHHGLSSMRMDSL